MFNGFKGEDKYRVNLVSTIAHTNYDNLKEICSKLEYSFSPYDLIRIANCYKKENTSINKKIEYILNDCNFHSECSLLMNGKADELIELSKKEIEESIIEEVRKTFIDQSKNCNDSFIPANSTLLDSFSLEELFFCIDKGIIQKRECDGFAFELTAKEKNKCEDLIL